ncbi:unnamed protein product [Anisakis simplex]|uniref:C2 domain-containing protein n=1 Tax=Anisakis simplex TaxID=6269 RepID=A0A3P6QC35_ANISI|nr:unnamed protein product [Anisakis simplex]
MVGVEWKQGCQSTGACAEPIFRITQRNVINNEKISKSWKVLKDFEKVSSLYSSVPSNFYCCEKFSFLGRYQVSQNISARILNVLVFYNALH